MIIKYYCKRCMKEITNVLHSTTFIEIVDGSTIDADIFTLCDSCYAALFTKFMQPNKYSFKYKGDDKE